MAIFEQNITIQAPVDKVFNYVTDPANRVEWLSRVKDVRNITGEGKDQKWDFTYKMPGKTMNGTVEVTEYVPGERYAHKTSTGFARTWAYDFSAENGNTRLHISVEMVTFTTPLLGRIIEKQMLRQSKREAERAVTNIKKKLEK
jgi:uncharacterized protein YndB with AHSA1/START domain